MSYTPNILIRKTDLEKNRDKIEAAVFNEKIKGNKKEAYHALYKAMNISTIKFPELEIVMIQPELSAHNKEVRNLMHTLKIDFQTDD